MSKSIKYSNPNFNKKAPEKEVVAQKPITLSLVVSINQQKEQIPFFIESLKKIKPEFLSKLELILVNQQANETLMQSDVIVSYKEQNVLKTLNGSASKSKSTAMGIAEATKEFVLVLDIDPLSNIVNINEFFNEKRDLSNAVVAPVFMQKEKKKTNKANLSMVFGNKVLIGYLFNNILSCNEYQSALDYELKQLSVEVKPLSMTQSSPFSHPKSNPLYKCLSCLSTRVNWFFISPLKELTNRPNKELLPLKMKESSIYRLLFASVALFTFFLIPILSYQSGNSGDEDKFQYPQAEKIYKFYTTFGKDKSYQNKDNPDMEGMRDYGMSFDTFTSFVNHIFGIEDVMESRHAMNGLVGWLAMFFCALLAYRLANWRAALITFILMFFSPRFLGHSFNNPKDIPFAMAYIFTIYYMIRFFQNFPKPSIKDSFMVALGIGLAISVRIGGFLLVAYLGLFGAMWVYYTTKLNHLLSSEGISKIKKVLGYFFVISIIGYFIGVLFWPYALESPFSNPKKSLDVMSHFNTSLRQIYEGAMIWSDKVPWYYTIKYMMITIPLSVIIGALAYIILYKKRGLQNFWAFILLFSFAFPVFYIAYSHANVYGGWRHAIFAYPTLVVLAGLGFNKLIDVFKQKYLKLIAVAILAVFTIHPIMHTIKNHPYEYVYFNELAGGVKGAYGQYELDYYFHSLREASEWVKDNAKKDANTTGDKIVVGAWLTHPISYYMRKDTSKFQVAFVRYYERSTVDWDYAIFANTGVSPDQLKNKSWPPKNTVHTIDVDGVPICAILKRNSKDDLLASQLKAKSENPKDSMNVRMANIIEADRLFKKALADEPNNENILFSLTEMYMNRGSLDSANMFVDRLLKIYPTYENALNMKGWIGLQKFDKTKNATALEDSRLAFEKVTKINYKFVYGYYGLAMTYIRLNDLNKAIQALEEALKVNPGFQEAANLLNQLKNYSSQQGGM